ncbi:WD repeat-containing protein 27 isoform X2 [Alosa alosa]|uniref:WD repeat-containing protein 27 isoform X2 n=1 Tax=Alosa alosa TaxID=278164 RepID=UPI00201523C7|nr:WD repeat-containing protein 27 isoform X2 [Alosa alosa]
MDGRKGTEEDGAIREIFSMACDKLLTYTQLDCCSSHSALPWQGKNLMIHSITDPSQKPLHLTGHHGNVSAISFGKNRDPLMLCSASEDYVIAWDVARCYRKAREGAIVSGTVIGTLLGKVVHLSFCSLDKKVSVCAGSKIYILNSKKEEVLAVLKGHLGPVTASVFFPWDTNILVSTSEDRTFKVWDLAKEEILYQSAVLSGCPLLSVYVTEDSKQLITGSSDGQVWHHTVLDDYKCRLVTKLDLHNIEQKQRRIQESQAQQTAGISATTGDGVIVETVKPVLGIFTFKPYSRHTEERDGGCLWIGSSDGLYLVNLASSELLMAFHFKDYPDLSITLAGSLAVTQTDCNIHCVVTSLFEPRMALWDIRLPGQLDGLCSQLEKAFPGQELSVVPSFPPMPTSPLNAELTRRDPNPPKKAGPGKPGGVKDQSVVFHTQVKSSGYAVCSQRKMFTPKTNIQKKTQRPTKTTKKIDGLLREYPSGLAAPSAQHTLLSASPTHTPVFCLQYSGNGKQVLCGLGDSSVLLYKCSLSGSPSVYTGHNKAVSSVCWSHSCGWFLSASEDQSLRIWAAGSKEPTLIMGRDRFSKPVRSAQFYYLDKFLLLASGSSVHLFLSHLDPTRDDIKRYEQKSFSRLVRSFSTKSGTDITAMSAINDFFSYIVLSCGADRSIQVFDLNVGSVAMEIPESHSRAAHHITQNKGSMYCSQSQDSYNLFLTSAITDGMKLWDLRTSRCVRKYEGHVNRCHQCTAAFSPCGRFIATGSEDNCAYVYDIRSSSYLYKLQRHTDTVLNVSFNPATPELLTGTLDGKLGLFRPGERASLP